MRTPLGPQPALHPIDICLPDTYSQSDHKKIWESIVRLSGVMDWAQQRYSKRSDTVWGIAVVEQQRAPARSALSPVRGV
jgi:hypothetical protein